MRRSSSKRWVLAVLLLLAACTGGPDQRQHADGLTVGVKTKPSPAELGEQRFTFFVEDEGPAALDAEVAFRMYMPGMPMSTDQAWTTARSEGRGRYVAQGDFSMGGSWLVEVRVRRPEHEPATFRFPFEIAWELK